MDEISTGISRRGFVLGGVTAGVAAMAAGGLDTSIVGLIRGYACRRGFQLFHVLLISSRAAAKPPRTSQDRRDGGTGRSNEMRRRILRDGRILNCQTGVDPTRAVNGDCGGDRLGQGRD